MQILVDDQSTVNSINTLVVLYEIPSSKKKDYISSVSCNKIPVTPTHQLIVILNPKKYNKKETNYHFEKLQLVIFVCCSSLQQVHGRFSVNRMNALIKENL